MEDDDKELGKIRKNKEFIVTFKKIDNRQKSFIPLYDTGVCISSMHNNKKKMNKSGKQSEMQNFRRGCFALANNLPVKRDYFRCRSLDVFYYAASCIRKQRTTFHNLNYNVLYERCESLRITISSSFQVLPLPPPPFPRIENRETLSRRNRSYNGRDSGSFQATTGGSRRNDTRNPR